MTPYSSFRDKRTPIKPFSDKRLRYEAGLDEVRPALKERSGGWCEAALPGCRGRATHPHHRKRRSQGGTNELVNLLDTCDSCHRSIHLNPTASFDCGLLVRRGADPDKVAILRDSTVWGDSVVWL